MNSKHKNNTCTFPPSFLWGAATSSHQIEGGNDNDWTEWEKESAQKRAEKMNCDASDLISAEACDSWDRYQEDHQIINELGLNAYRFSLEWSRIEPEKGNFSKEAIIHYQKMIDSLTRRNIKPVVTLWHWTLPKWLAGEGGVFAEDFVDRYLRYVKYVMEDLGSEVEFWITINEPLVYATDSYLSGNRPPNKKNIFQAFSVVNRLIKAHNSAQELIKELRSESKVGYAKGQLLLIPYRDRFYNKLICKILGYIWNDYFIKQTIGKIDFIGANYYTKAIIDITGQKKDVDAEEDMKWYYNPSGVYHVLKNLEKYGLPIYITENGLPDSSDKYRGLYIERVVKAMCSALNEGVDLRGYFHWSLLDNFEWDSGYGPKFGLVEIDSTTKERKIKKSAFLYRDIIKSFERHA